MKARLAIHLVQAVLALTGATSAQTESAESAPASRRAELVASLRKPGGMVNRGDYTVSLYADGTVVFEARASDPLGSRCLDGRHVGRVPLARRDAIVKAFLDAGYLDFKDAYDDQKMTDVGSLTSSFSYGGRTRSVFRDLSDPAAPASLTHLEQLVDALATPRWKSIGVSWLSLHQNEDGSWSGSGFPKQCDALDGPQCADEAPTSWSAVTTTALALLPLAAAHPYWQREENASQAAAVRGVDWLVTTQSETGNFGRDGDPVASLTQAWATTAVCSYRRGWTNLRHPKAAAAATLALIRMQDWRGAWPAPAGAEDGEIVATGWAALALRTADRASVFLDRRRLTMAGNFLEEQAEALAATRPKAFDRAHEARVLRAASMAVCARAWAPDGLPKDASCAAILATVSVGALADATLDPGTAFFLLRANDLLDLEKRSDGIWRYVRAAKVADGCRSGSWDPRPTWGPGGGRLSATSMGLLAELAFWRARDLPGGR